LGLRSLFFALAGIMKAFHHLHYGLSAILIFVGLKMVVSEFYHIPVAAALAVVGGILLLSVIASLIWPEERSSQES
jgi:tellurite resistance protein TerC